MSTNTQAVSQPLTKETITALLLKTPANEIADLALVKEKYISVHNACMKDGQGELIYNRQALLFKQLVNSNKDLPSCDTITLYACFISCAVNNYSLDPHDAEVYMIPLKGKAVLWIQAGAHIKRLMRTNQIAYCEQAKLVYQGDLFEVENGRVVRHVEKFETETIIAGYVRMVVDTKAQTVILSTENLSGWPGLKKV